MKTDKLWILTLDNHVESWPWVEELNRAKAMQLVAKQVVLQRATSTEDVTDWMQECSEVWLSRLGTYQSVWVRTQGWPALWELGLSSVASLRGVVLSIETLMAAVRASPGSAFWWLDAVGLDHDKMLALSFNNDGYGWSCRVTSVPHSVQSICLEVKNCLRVDVAYEQFSMDILEFLHLQDP